MQRLLYHPIFAWNLIEEAVKSDMLEEPEWQSYWGRQRLLGQKQGWLNSYNRQRAREMFVLTEQVLLPGELDVPVPSQLLQQNYVNWWQHTSPDLQKKRWALKMAKYCFEEVSELKPYILQGLEEKRFPIDEKRFDKLIAWWRDIAEWEKTYLEPLPEDEQRILNLMRDSQAWQAVLKAKELADLFRKAEKDYSSILQNDPYKQKQKYRQLETIIEDEFNVLRQILLVASYGVPTFSPFRIQKRFEPETATGYPEETLAIVNLYFNGVVRCPGPKDLNEALEFKTNDRISQWREKIFAWGNQLVSGQSTLADIKREIEDANEWLEGGKSLSHIIPWWVICIAAPIELIMKIFHLQHPVEWVFIGVHVIKAYGLVVEKAVTDPNRSKNQWLMISRNS